MLRSSAQQLFEDLREVLREVDSHIGKHCTRIQQPCLVSIARQPPLYSHVMARDVPSAAKSLFSPE